MTPATIRDALADKADAYASGPRSPSDLASVLGVRPPAITAYIGARPRRALSDDKKAEFRAALFGVYPRAVPGLRHGAPALPGVVPVALLCTEPLERRARLDLILEGETPGDARADVQRAVCPLLLAFAERYGRDAPAVYGLVGSRDDTLIQARASALYMAAVCDWTPFAFASVGARGAEALADASAMNDRDELVRALAEARAAVTRLDRSDNAPPPFALEALRRIVGQLRATVDADVYRRAVAAADIARELRDPAGIAWLAATLQDGCAYVPRTATAL